VREDRRYRPAVQKEGSVTRLDPQRSALRSSSPGSSPHPTPRKAPRRRAASPAPKDLVASEDTLQLYHYRPICEQIYRVPLLFVMSPVNRSYIVDLVPGQSLIEFLAARGFDVYLIGWTAPRPEHHTVRHEDFALEWIPQCIDRVRAESGEDEVSLLGYHLGGMLACMYAATHPHGPLKNLICFATPTNAEAMVACGTWSPRDPWDIDRAVEKLGTVPAELVLGPVRAWRPSGRTPAFLKDSHTDDDFVRAFFELDRCLVDRIPLPAGFARQFVAEILQANKFVKNEFRLGKQRVDLTRIRAPFLHVLARYDHLVPPAAAKDLLGLVGSDDKTEIVLQGDHASLFIGGNAVYRLWPKLDAWLSVRSL